MSSKERRTLLDVIDAGLRALPPVRPRRQANNRPDEVVQDRYEALRNWRRERAQARGVEPDVILSNRILRELAKQNPSSPRQLEQSRILNDWERREYGREIVALLRRQARIGPR
jgi:ribonuclease D